MTSAILNQTMVSSNETDSSEFSYRSDKDLLIRRNEANTLLLLPVIIFVFCLMLLGFIGNSLVCYVHMTPKVRARRTTQRTFILTLAIFDILNCVLVIPFEISDMWNQYTFQSNYTCKIFRFIETTLVLSSGFTLLSVSIDRYVHLAKPSRTILTVMRAKFLAVMCVVASTMISWPMLIFAGTEEFDFESEGRNITAMECTSLRDGVSDLFDPKYYNYVLVLIFVSALISLIVFYTLIGVKLFKRRQGSTRNGLRYVGTDKETQKLRPLNIPRPTMRLSSVGYVIGKPKPQVRGGTIVFYSVTAVFIIGFLPHLTVRLLRQFKVSFTDNHASDYTEVLYNLLVRSYMINNAANPFIYSILNIRFRQELIATFKHCFCRGKQRYT